MPFAELANRPRNGNPPALLASELSKVLDVANSDDELIGADPDEVAFARGDVGEESADWFELEHLW